MEREREGGAVVRCAFRLEFSPNVLMMCNKSDNDTKASVYILQQHEQGKKRNQAE